MSNGINCNSFLPGVKRAIVILLFLLTTTTVFSQNDHCNNASIVNIPNNGYGIATVNSTINDISAATIQPGETFAPAIVIAGQTQKSIWYKFTLPTTRAVRVSLAQSGTGIASGDVGFAVYKADACLPTVAQISTKLTPLGLFGSTFHPCVEQGVYLVQVSAKSSANGNVYIQVQTGNTNADYDNAAQAYDFGTLSQGIKTVSYSADCQSTEDAAEVCTALNNYQQYNKSSWHVFKTPTYFDYIAFFLSYQDTLISQTFGYKLYQGDARTTPLSSLTLIDGCDTLRPTTFAAREFYSCGDLNTNSTYSIQLFFHRDFYDSVQVTLATMGTTPTQAPLPVLSGIPPSNSLGVLPSSASGIITSSTDYHACNSRHSIHPCAPSLPAAGVYINSIPAGGIYNLSTFYTFSLSSPSNIIVSAQQAYCGELLLVRIYKQGLSNTCVTLDTINMISQSDVTNLYCLDPGNYTIQVMGRDTLQPVNAYASNFGYFTNNNNPICGLTGLGQQFTLTIMARTISGTSNYSLHTAGAFDPLNAVAGIMQPLVNAVNYSSIDTFSCPNTVLPWDTSCSPVNKKALYREFSIADSGIVTLYNATPPGFNGFSKLYKGDANALAVAQNVFSYPSKITGLQSYTPCIQSNYSCDAPAQVCTIPGTYTYVSFGADGDVTQVNQVDVLFNSPVNTIHNSPATAEDMGDVLSQVPPTGGSIQSLVDHFSCRDNAVLINGYVPCLISNQTATKAIYRQFYLSAPVNVSISGVASCGYKNGVKTLFAGKATDGISGLTVLPDWQCFTTSQQGSCNALPAGWYTLVCYGIGPTYGNQTQTDIGNYQTFIGKANKIIISIIIPCSGPKYNRPYKAAIDTTTGQPFLIEWAPRVGHTAAYPKTDTTYTLYKENYNCIADTPFNAHPIPNCGPSTKVTYYVFRTTQESYVSSMLPDLRSSAHSFIDSAGIRNRYSQGWKVKNGSRSAWPRS